MQNVHMQALALLQNTFDNYHDKKNNCSVARHRPEDRWAEVVQWSIDGVLGSPGEGPVN